MRIYLDLVMGLNFAVDYLLLMGSNQLMGVRCRKWRCAWAAAFGAAYAGVCLLPGMEMLGSWPARLATLGAIGIWAFGTDVSAMKRLAVFALLSMALGGLAAGVAAGGGWEALLCAAGIWALCVLAGGTENGRRQYLKIKIQSQGRKVSVMALVDSGNSLKDPLTGAPVLVLGPGEAEILLGLGRQELRDPTAALLQNPGQRLRLIPYSSVGGAGFLLGKRFCDVWIGDRKCAAVVAFSPETIGAGEPFQALAGGMLV